MAFDTERDEAHSDGKHARRDGHPIDDCPHGPGTSLGNAWRQGWRWEDAALRFRADATAILADPFAHPASLRDVAARTIASARAGQILGN